MWRLLQLGTAAAARDVYLPTHHRVNIVSMSISSAPTRRYLLPLRGLMPPPGRSQLSRARQPPSTVGSWRGFVRRAVGERTGEWLVATINTEAPPCVRVRLQRSRNVIPRSAAVRPSAQLICAVAFNDACVHVQQHSATSLPTGIAYL